MSDLNVLVCDIGNSGQLGHCSLSYIAVYIYIYIYIYIYKYIYIYIYTPM